MLKAHNSIKQTDMVARLQALGFVLASKYRGSRYPLKLKCTSCGTIKTIRYAGNYRVAKCECKHVQPIRTSIQDYQRKLDQHGIWRALRYNGAMRPAVLKCNHCGKIRRASKACSPGKCECQYESRTITEAEYLDRLFDKHGDRFELVSDYGPRVTIRCTTCDHEREIDRYNSLHGIKCPCEYKKTGPAKRTKKDWQQAIDKVRGKNQYKIVGEVKNRKYVFRHACGKTFTTSPSNLTRADQNVFCPCQYMRVMEVTRDMHAAEVVELRGDAFELVNFVRKGKCTYRHVPCGHEWKTSRRSFLLSKGCPKCNGPCGTFDRRWTLPELQELVDAKHGAGKYILSNLQHISRPRKIRCTILHDCGHSYEGSPGSLAKGYNRCPRCFRVRFCSTKEVRFADAVFKCQGYEPLLIPDLVARFGADGIITSLDRGMPRIDYTYKGKRCRYIPDFYIPSKNLLVEVKSPFTLGLVRDLDRFYPTAYLSRMQAKARRCIALGYKFELVVYRGRHGHRLHIPKNWLDMDKYQLAHAIGIDLRRVNR